MTRFGLSRRGHRLFGNVDSFLVNCLLLRRLLASVRSGVVKTFRCTTSGSLMLEPSRLHRLLHLQPGLTPSWIASCRSCAGFDLLTAAQSLAIVGSIALFKFSQPLPALLLILVVIAFAALLHMPFENVERFARARIRRRECVSCGTTKLKDAAIRCHSCTSI